MIAHFFRYLFSASHIRYMRFSVATIIHLLKNISIRAGEILQEFFAKMSFFCSHYSMPHMDLASCYCRGIQGMFLRGWYDVSDHRYCRARILLVLANTAITMNAPVMTFCTKG